MKPYYERGGITIYHGDALEVLPALQAGIADMVATDPPYMLGGASTRRGERPQSPVADWTNASRWYRDWLAESFRISKPAAPAWMFGNLRTLPVLEIAVQSLARRVTSTLVWNKDWIGVGSMNGLRCQYELVFLMGGPDFAIANRSVGDIWTEKWASSRPNGHTQEKPESLMRRLIQVSDPPAGGLIVDPFMGSGTTLVAAAAESRNAIGVEIEERYCEMAAKRLSGGPLYAIEGAAREIPADLGARLD